MTMRFWKKLIEMSKKDKEMQKDLVIIIVACLSLVSWLIFVTIMSF